MNFSSEKVIVFLHIPKTGGQTLWTIIEKLYSRHEFCHWVEFRTLSAEQKDSLKCVIRHEEYFADFYQYIPKPYTYFTMLRDPVDRVISTFYYMQRSPGDPLYARTQTMSLTEFVRQMASEEQFEYRSSNVQTRYLSGGDPYNLEKAKENLEKYFAVVGITEMYNQSLYLMMKEFGWKPTIKFPKMNVAKKRAAADEIPEAARKLIEQYNECDIKLYEYGKQLFQRKIESLDEQSRQELHTVNYFSSDVF